MDSNHPSPRGLPPFWALFTPGNIQIVVGRFFQFRSFEPSGFLGVGTALALAELQKHLATIGLHDTVISYADRLEGDALNTHLILLGGPESNALVKKVTARVRPTLLLGDPDTNETSVSDSVSGNRYTPVLNGYDLINDYGVVLRSSNPFAPGKQLLLVAGCFGFGTWAGVRYLLSEAFARQELVAQQLPFEALVEAPVIRDTPEKIKLVTIRELRATA